MKNLFILTALFTSLSGHAYFHSSLYVYKQPGVWPVEIGQLRAGESILVPEINIPENYYPYRKVKAVFRYKEKFKMYSIIGTSSVAMNTPGITVVQLDNGKFIRVKDLVPGKHKIKYAGSEPILVQSVSTYEFTGNLFSVELEAESLKDRVFYIDDFAVGDEKLSLEFDDLPANLKEVP